MSGLPKTTTKVFFPKVSTQQTNSLFDMAEFDSPIVKGTQNAAMPLAPPPAREDHTQLSGTDKLRTLKFCSDDRPLTQRQRKVEEKVKLVGAMNSGLTPV
jgi:hypothetical protein